jgi:tRNA dimethylallyltransferase
VVGGTGFYFRALIEGLFAGPGRSESLRSRLRRIVAARGPEAIHRILQHIDPETAARLAPADAERNIRAYEIFRISGKTMSWWQSRPRDDLKGYRWLKLGIAWPRTLLYERIDRRAEEMVRKGFVAEVRQLAARLSRDCQAFKAIGYRQVLAYLDGVWSLEEAVEDMQRESRRYAKRQTTWFRSDTDILWLDPASGAEALQRQAAERIDAFLTDASFRTSRL